MTGLPAKGGLGTRRYSRNDVDRLHDICVLAGDGLNLAGIRRVLALQEEARRLRAEIDQLQAEADARPSLGLIPG